VAGFCQHGNEAFVSIKDGVLLELLRKKDCTP
jgi:hypothetical protein